MVLVKLGSEEQRREVLTKRRNLRDRMEKIMNWTWKERRMKWKLEEIEMRREKRIEYGIVEKPSLANI